MAVPNLIPTEEPRSANQSGFVLEPSLAQAQANAVSWGAIVSGAAAAAALSLILFILGTGLGLSSVSPWAYAGVGATTFGISAILWITFTQLVASGVGGYMAGRLTPTRAGMQVDEIYFRDTAHGFLAWAVASLATAALLTSVIGSIIDSGVQAGATVAGGAAATNTNTTSDTANSAGGAAVGAAMMRPDRRESTGYFVDSLFRTNTNSAAPGRSESPTASPTAEQRSSAPPPPEVDQVNRIFTRTLLTGSLPAEDARYIGQLVAQRTGLTQDEAERRVNDTYARMRQDFQQAENAAKEAADEGRKASAYTALWLSVSLFIGAFIASFSAVYGGRHRDAN